MQVQKYKNNSKKSDALQISRGSQAFIRWNCEAATELRRALSGKDGGGGG